MSMTINLNDFLEKRLNNAELLKKKKSISENFSIYGSGSDPFFISGYGNRTLVQCTISQLSIY